MQSDSIRARIKPLFIIYTVIMLWLLFGQRLHQLDFTDYVQRLLGNINLVPFRTVRLFGRIVKYGTDYSLVNLALRNLAGNVILFVPLGFLPIMHPRLESFLRFITAVAVIISLVELLQLFTLLGSCDIDDLILNLIGAVSGYCIYKLFFSK